MNLFTGSGASRPWLRITNFGFRHYCPICRAHLREFVDVNWGIQREHARCPVCSSLERQRSVWLYLQGRTELFDGRPKRLLHFAPELELERLVRRVPNISYLSADLQSPRAMLKADLRRLPMEDHSFDVIYCSHVLEYIDDDRQAMRELRRVLKPTGWMVLQDLIWDQDTTVDVKPNATPEERERVCGHRDWVRRYGKDFLNRVGSVGLNVTCEHVEDLYSSRAIQRCGLRRLDKRCSAEDIFFCRYAKSAG